MIVPVHKVIASFTFAPNDYRVEPVPVIQMIGRDGHSFTLDIEEALAIVVIDPSGIAHTIDPDCGRLGRLH